MWEFNYKESWAPKNWCFWAVVLEKILESSLGCKEIKPVNSKGNQLWVFIRRTDAEAEAPILWPLDAKSQLIRKEPDAGKDWGQEDKGLREDEMVGWHQWLNGHEFEQAPGDSEGQGSLACCNLRGHNKSDTTEQLNNNKWYICVCVCVCVYIYIYTYIYIDVVCVCESHSVIGLGRSPGDGKGYPLQYFGLENSMDSIVHGVAKGRTRLGPQFNSWVGESIIHISMEYYSAMRQKEILSFVTIWMKLEDIMLSEMHQKETNIVWPHIYVESKIKSNSFK